MPPQPADDSMDLKIKIPQVDGSRRAFKGTATGKQMLGLMRPLLRPSASMTVSRKTRCADHVMFWGKGR